MRNYEAHQLSQQSIIVSLYWSSTTKLPSHTYTHTGAQVLVSRFFSHSLSFVRVLSRQCSKVVLHLCLAGNKNKPGNRHEIKLSLELHFVKKRRRDTQSCLWPFSVRPIYCLRVMFVHGSWTKNVFAFLIAASFVTQTPTSSALGLFLFLLQVSSNWKSAANLGNTGWIAICKQKTVQHRLKSCRHTILGIHAPT